MRGVYQDLRYGVRVLRKDPGFTAVAVFTLALGIAVNTTVFSWIDAVLCAPFREPATVSGWQSSRS